MRHIGVGSQSLVGGQDAFLPENMCMKNLQNARILHDICQKKIFYQFFRRGCSILSPDPYAYDATKHTLTLSV